MSFPTPYDATHAQQARSQQTPPSQSHTPRLYPPPPPPPLPPLHQRPRTNPYHQQQQRQQQQQQQHPSHQSRSVKRPRPVKSCTECRKRKLRCDRLCPCSQCQRSGRPCKYAADSDPGNLSDVSDGEATDAAGRPVKRSCASSAVAAAGGSGGADAGWGGDGDSAVLPLLEELSGRMGRLEKHLMGTSSPAETADPGHGGSGSGGWRKGIGVSPRTLRDLSIKQGGMRTRLWGPSSSRVLLNLFDEAKDFLRHQNKDPDTREMFVSFRKLHMLLKTKLEKSLTPIAVFVDSMMPINKCMADVLPKRHVCDRLLRGYLDKNEALYRVIHVPTFTREYESYWDGTLLSEAFLAKILGILSIASRFETKSRGLGHEGSEGVHLPTASALMRLWLNNLRGRQLGELETLQVELLWLLSKRMIREDDREGWAQLGSIVRMAMGMGLHRDPSEFGPRIAPFNAEMRRRLWATVADLDYYVSNDCDLPSLLREEDATTEPPRNLDDAELHPDMKELPPGHPFDRVTDNHVQAYAAMTFGLRKKAAVLVARVDTIRGWSEILEVGTKLERHLDEIDFIFPRRQHAGDDSRGARLRRCRGLLECYIRQTLLHLYRPFVLGVASVPQQLVRAYLRHSASIVQSIEELDPPMPHSDAVADLCRVGLRGDAVQAALSMCYYIRAATRPSKDPSLMRADQALSAAPETDTTTATTCPADGVLWSTARLIRAVETVRGFLIQNIKRGDTRDVICLSAVLESVRTPEPRTEDMARGLRAVLAQCLRAANCSPERLAALSAQSETAQGQAEAYGFAGQNGAYQPHGAPLSSLADEDGWVFWDGWD